MAAGLVGDPGGFGFPSAPGVDGEDAPDGLEDDLIIPDIYQRIILQHRYVHEREVDESSQEEDVEDYDLTAPPIDS